MKKIIALALSLLLLLALLAACGGEEPAGTQPSGAVGEEPTGTSSGEAQTEPGEVDVEKLLDAQKDRLMEAIGKVTDISVFSEKEGDIYHSPTMDGAGSKEYTLKASQGSAEISSVVVGSHEFVGGQHLNVSEYVGMGWSCFIADQVVSPGFAVDMPCQSPDGKNAMLSGMNPTDKELGFTDCVVTKVYVGYDELYFSSASAEEMQINGSTIVRTDPLTKIIEVVGCPSKIYIQEWFADDDYQDSYVTLSYESNGGVLELEFEVS